MPKPKRRTIQPFSPHHRTLEAFQRECATGYNFWLFHGVNYLSGLTPFPGIYRGEEIYRSAIFDHIMSKHLVGDQLTEKGRLCLTWASSKPAELHNAVELVAAFARKYKRDPHLPNDPYVAVGIRTVATLMVQAQIHWGETYDTPWDYYYEVRKRYDEDMMLAVKKASRIYFTLKAGKRFWREVHRQTIEMLGLPPGVKPFL